MWYLIVPPLIFLGSLWLLLFFLSRRVADPALQGEIENTPEGTSRGFLFLKEDTGLRILEKLTQRIKVSTLKMHNTFNTLSQSIRKRREISEEQKKERAEALPEASTIAFSPTPAPVAPTEKRNFFGRFGRKKTEGSVASQAPSFPGEGMPILRRHREVTEKPKRLVSEEDLIEKIAKNPKDSVAYEELGDYYMETRSLDDAKACYRQVIKLSPFNRPVKDKVRKLERLLTEKRR